jgi:hypothetical protein
MMCLGLALLKVLLVRAGATPVANNGILAHFACCRIAAFLLSLSIVHLTVDTSLCFCLPQFTTRFVQWEAWSLRWNMAF